MLMPQEITGETDLEAGANMHHRQAENAYHFTVLIALPGAYEKLEDLLWLLPSAPLDVHPKPVGLLNVNGCYDKVLAAMDRGVKTGFISAKSRGVVVSAPTAEELLKKLKEYVLRLAEESNQFRPEMQLRQDFYWQVPFEVENDIDTEVDKAASDFKNANVGLKRTVALLKLTQNLRIEITLLCCILGMAAYLCNVLKK